MNSIRVDESKCAASGNCARIAPDLFELDDMGYSQVIGDGTVPDERKDAALEAVRSCPLEAVSLDPATAPRS